MSQVQIELLGICLFVFGILIFIACIAIIVAQSRGNTEDDKKLNSAEGIRQPYTSVTQPKVVANPSNNSIRQEQAATLILIDAPASGETSVAAKETKTIESKKDVASSVNNSTLLSTSDIIALATDKVVRLSLFNKLLPEGQTKKSDWQVFEHVLKAHGINKLYHFTDSSNIASIRNVGELVSWYSCKEHGVSMPKPGGNALSWQLDSDKGLADYVRLSFVSDHPMKYIAKKDGRISSPVVLEIDVEVVFLQETRFCPVNAAKNGATAESTLESLSTIKFQLFRRKYFDLSNEEKSSFQAEVLVYKMVPAKYILNLDRLAV